jgi:NAD(P)-dependent dehydrogenase (short-subunit alcohol dehydrogenase family)
LIVPRVIAAGEAAMEAKCALITGGAQGIGKAMVQAFLAAGYSVAVVDSDSEAGHETVQEYAPLGRMLFIPGDVSEPTLAQHAVSEAERTFGRLDVLINNAGIFLSKPLEHLSVDDWLHLLGVNLHGAFFFAHCAAAPLRRTRGAIINIASTRALMSEPHTEAYAASKGGLVALTHALATSLAPDVRVNCISPGWIDVSGWKKRSSRRTVASLRPVDHAQHLVGRVGMPEDVARMALFLAGDESGFITGQNFVVDGGMTRKMIYAE